MKSLIYFDDAEPDEMPRMLKQVKWGTVKKYFEGEVKKLSRWEEHRDERRKEKNTVLLVDDKKDVLAVLWIPSAPNTYVFWNKAEQSFDF